MLNFLECHPAPKDFHLFLSKHYSDCNDNDVVYYSFDLNLLKDKTSQSNRKWYLCILIILKYLFNVQIVYYQKKKKNNNNIRLKSVFNLLRLLFNTIHKCRLHWEMFKSHSTSLDTIAWWICCTNTFFVNLKVCDPLSVNY